MRMLTVAGAAAAMLMATGALAQNGLYGSTNSGFGTGSNPNSHTSSGYTTNHGTYVQPHQATNPNNTQFDNYGTRGNVNPFTGNVGTRNPSY